MHRHGLVPASTVKAGRILTDVLRFMGLFIRLFQPRSPAKPAGRNCREPEQGADNLAKVGRWNDGPAKTQGPVCRGPGTASFCANVMQTEPCERAAPFAVARSQRLLGLIQSGLLRFTPVYSGLAWVRRVRKVPGQPQTECESMPLRTASAVPPCKRARVPRSAAKEKLPPRKLF